MGPHWVEIKSLLNGKVKYFFLDMLMANIGQNKPIMLVDAKDIEVNKSPHIEYKYIVI